MSTTYLLTGPPRVGKTSIIKRLIERVGRERCGGFYTEEVRDEGERVGFQLVTLDGKCGMLAQAGMKNVPQVKRYGVDLSFLETVGVPALYEAIITKDVVVLDEIGLMQVSSELFKHAVLAALASPRLLIGTIPLESHPWLDMLKQQQTIRLLYATFDNQEEIIKALLDALRST